MKRDAKNLTNVLALTAFWVAGLTTVVVLFAVIGYVFVNGAGQISLSSSSRTRTA